MDTIIKLPYYAKATLLLIGLYVFVSMLSIGQSILLPVIYATIIAILISPAVNFLISKGMTRFISSASVIIIGLLIVVGLIALLSSQASRFSEALPQLTDKFEALITQIVTWASGFFDVSAKKINAWIADTKGELMGNSNIFIGTTLSTMGGILSAALLTPVYIFMILFYQPHLIEFVHKVFGTGNDGKVSEILTETKGIVQSYLVGLFVEFTIVAILNSVALLILGINYAILLGIAGALLNIIPYLGGVITMVLFSVIALVTKSPVYALYVLMLYTLIQLIDNNYIVPKIVGAKVKLNALVSLIVVIVGAALWGVPGMLLSIPLTAIIKLILDRIEPLAPWGFLLGDAPSSAYHFFIPPKKWKRKLVLTASKI